MKPSDADLGDTTGVPESPGVKATRSSGPPLYTSGASIDPLAMTGTSSGQATARVGRPGFDVDAELARAQLELRLYGAGRAEGGPRVGKYLILDHLGRGGMGSVYTVYNPDLDRKSVIKLVRPDRSSPDSRRRLLREARLTATLSHPNVVQIHDSGEYHDEIYVVMEFIAGVDLDAWRRQGPHAWPEVLAVYRQAGLGLAAAHARGVVHRDFTPRNAMLGEDGRVRVLDFGLAHARRDTGEGGAPGEGGEGGEGGAVVARSEPSSGDSLTATGAIVGTPRYMSPEQLRSAPTDGRSDQFSFCVALWEALLGHLPFMGADLFEYNEAALAGDIRPPEDLRGVPRRVLKALRRGLAPRADDRFADMHALLAALDVRPLRPRVVLGGVAGALALVGLWFLAQPATPVSPREQCAAELADELPVTWSGLPGPIAGRLGEFADRWRAARVELCAAGLAGGLPAPALRRGLHCLEQQRAVFALLVDRVTAGDALELDLGALPDGDRVAACTDPLRLADGAAPPSPAAREVVSRVEADLARAEAALILGRYPESEAIAASAVRRVREIGHEPTLAAALYQLARVQTYGPNAEAAEATLREAAGLAERHDLHDLAADVYLRLVRVAMAHGERSADGGVWFAVLGYKLARLDERHGRRWAEGLAYLGAIALDARELATAGSLFERGAEVEAGAGPLRRGLVELRLGRVARLRGDGAEAAGRLARGLALAEEELGPEDPQLVQFLANLGEVQLELRELDAAEATIGRGLAIAAGAAGRVYRPQLLLAAAQVVELRGDLAAAGALAREARALLRDRALPADVRSYRGAVLDLVARAAFAAGDATAALDAYSELLAVAEGHLSREAARLLVAYRNAAGLAVMREQPALALRFVAAAGPLLSEPGLAAATGEALRVELAAREGEALLALGRPAAAVAVAERALERWDPQDRRGDAATADLHLLCFEALKERAPAQALPHARAALRYFAGEASLHEITTILETWLRRYRGPR